MGRGRSNQTGRFRKAAYSPSSRFKQTVPREVRDMNSRLYDSLRSVDSDWKKEGEIVSFDKKDLHISCYYTPETISHKSRRLYHQDKRILLVHVSGAPFYPQKDKLEEYIKTDVDVNCFGKSVIVKSRTGKSGIEQAQKDVDEIIKPIVSYILDNFVYL